MRISESKLRSIIRSVITESWREHSKIDSIKYGSPEEQRSQLNNTSISKEGDVEIYRLSDNLEIEFAHCGDKYIHSESNPDYYAIKIVLRGSDVDYCKRKRDEKLPELEELENLRDMAIFKYTCGMASAVKEMLRLRKNHESKKNFKNPFGLFNPSHEAAYSLMQSDIRAPRNRNHHVDDNFFVASAFVNLDREVRNETIGADIAVHKSINFKKFCIKSVQFILSQYETIQS